jgi:hypothetical protein
MEPKCLQRRITSTLKSFATLTGRVASRPARYVDVMHQGELIGNNR